MDWNKSENEKLRKADLRLSHICDQSLSSEAVGQQLSIQNVYSDDANSIPLSFISFATGTLETAMNKQNTFLDFLVFLSLRAKWQQPSLLSPWKFSLQALMYTTALRLWRVYKFALRAITGYGSIERVCKNVTQEYWCVEKENGKEERKLDLECQDVRKVIWRIGLHS